MLGFSDRALNRFAKKYENELVASARSLSRLSGEQINSRSIRAKFLKDLRDSDIVLVGDFHAQAQSTRSFYRLLRSAEVKEPVVCLECFQFSDQKVLNSFLVGEISERDFLRKIKWKESWGFPFETMRPLIRWCQSQKIPIYGVNTSSKIVDLKKRDAGIAENIKKVTDRYPNQTIFVLIGDFHLAKVHLPKELAKLQPAAKICTVLQSPEEIYFGLASRQLDQLDMVALGRRKWALMSVLPWIKWQEYLMFIEKEYDRKVNAADHDASEYVEKEAQFILGFLNPKLQLTYSPELLQSIDDGFYSHLVDSPKSVPKWMRSQIAALHSDGCSFLLIETNQAYLARPTVNHIARLSACIVLKQLGYLKKSIRFEAGQFERLIWLEMIIYFLNKLINPKKKSDTLGDIRRALQKERVDDRGKESLQLALEQRLREMRTIAAGKKSRFGKNAGYSGRSYRIASEILGSLRGEKLYFAYRKNRLKADLFQKMMLKDLHASYFEAFYYNSIELIDSWPSGFGSKFEKF